MENDKRRWHVSKEIPVALIVSIAGSLFLGGIAFQSLRGEQIAMGKQQTEIVARLDRTDGKVDRLSDSIQSGTVPNALNAARITALEQAIGDIRARVADNERRLASETLRAKANRMER